DLEYARSYVLSRLTTPIVKTFIEDEFKVEHAAAVIREAYIAEEREKGILLCATSYNIYAQNALLKLLEEPPRNIVFTIITRSKNALLPTIRSRMKAEVLKAQKPETELDIDIARLDLESIFLFLKKHQNIKKDLCKTVIEQLLHESLVTQGLRMKEQELERFETALELAELNSRPQPLLAMLLLEIYAAKMRRS
ncbi:MAG: DNA polymerase III subunit delta', partial [Sulfurospirillum sp.]